jgi:signal peptidase I
MTIEPYRPPASEPTGEPPEELRRHPAIAALLSLPVPGGGQIYNGRLALGLGLFLGVNALQLPYATAGLADRPWLVLALVGFALLLSLFSIVEAAVTARRHRRIASRPFLRWFVLVPILASLFAAGFLVPEPPRTKPARVPTAAMAPAIQPGEYVLIDYGHYREHRPQRGDVAVFLGPDDGLQIKRVIGLGGEQIEMQGLRAVVEGDPTLDRWFFPLTRTSARLMLSASSVDVPPGSLFVLGDHRISSRDSRSYGFIAEELLLGRAGSIVYSPDAKRIGRRLHD